MRFEIGHTHAYPGCGVRVPEPPGHAENADCLVEFSDGVAVPGSYVVQAEAIVLHVPAYRTARGTRVVAKSWLLQPDGTPGRWRVRMRLPVAPAEAE